MVYVKYTEVTHFCFTTRLSSINYYLQGAQIQHVYSYTKKIKLSNRTEAEIQDEKMQSNMHTANTQNIFST